jgi:hypothetical protein
MYHLVTINGELPYFQLNPFEGKRNSIHARKGFGIVIKERTLTLTVYNVYCDHCGARAGWN